jgi:hypothetical protein
VPNAELYPKPRRMAAPKGMEDDPMSKLSTKGRDSLPGKDFAGPGRSYPVEDKAHAQNAKARASQAVKAGRMSKVEESKIDAKADKKLKK